ncbi:MAG: indole-3-glycerol-phosphate synthase [Methylobacteriaceae bacterium]|jgi:indole-3-glycerol phosphate synthase|nr:indole-3-glycerol-phosphate synthase [Methylobacteriaceae bacterium]
MTETPLNMLEKFRLAKKGEIAKLRELAASGGLPPVFDGPRPGFTAMLKQKPVPVIAEYKRASPSKGAINLELTPAVVARAYHEAGAGAMSVLTESTYFKGELGFLTAASDVGLPLLRKDFIFHPLQVRHTAATPASAILLIVRCVDDDLLPRLVAKSVEFGLEPVVEVFDAAELARARRAGAAIIQVNNRDLDRLQVDLDVSRTLIRERAEGEFWITASGITSHAELAGMLALGFDAALIGSSLMAGGTPGDALRRIIGGAP